MSTYENAPATKLIATHCACCGRPLVDAVSVEAGIGPDCREKHGYAEAQGEADFAKALAFVANVAVDGCEADLGLPEDAHKAANWLTHKVACEQTGSRVLSYTNAIRALGYAKLASRIEDRLAKVRIEATHGRLVVRTPYNADAITELKKINGRKYDPATKAWSFPAEFKRAIWEVLKSYFPGSVGVGPKGLFQIV
jgi:hypothetical protein